MDTPLQGPDGKPAIDQQSGMPLTMEEMLRRRGIVRMGNTTSTIGPDSVASVQASTTNPASGVQASTGQTSRGEANPAVTAAMMAKSIPPELKDAPPQVAAQTLASSGADPSVISALETLGVVAVGTAAAYATYRGLRGGGSQGVEMPVREGMPTGVPEDAHFTDVNPAQIEGPQATTALKGRQQKALPAPPKKISASNPQALGAPNPSRAAVAQELAARAARGQPNDMAPIAGHAPIRTVSEPLDAGVTRTVGASSELAKILKANPGLLKTLMRVP